MEAPITRKRSDDVLTVARLNREARRLLESGLGMVRVEGEISNLAMPASGHWYFTLKDATAQVRCAMFRNRNRMVRWRPDNGMAVIVRGRVSLYEPRGDYQLIAESLREAGEGALQRAFEKLRDQLAAEGLFDEDRKQAIPTMPERVGVITSPSGAVVRDICHVLARRFPGLAVRVYPVPVQGDAAPDAIVAALELAARRGDCDTLILARGGGSLEDLQAFNDERVARAVAACPLPTVSAVGHETDVTICDFVADLRAPTPSAAAELVAPDAAELLTRLVALGLRLDRALTGELRHARTELKLAAQRLNAQHPGRHVERLAQRLDELERRGIAALRERVARARFALERSGNRLARQSPQLQLQGLAMRLAQNAQRLDVAVRRLLQRDRQRLALASRTLETIGPQPTLDRGYAIVTRDNRSVLTDAGDVKGGDPLGIRLARGRLKVTVKDND